MCDWRLPALWFWSFTAGGGFDDQAFLRLGFDKAARIVCQSIGIALWASHVISCFIKGNLFWQCVHLGQAVSLVILVHPSFFFLVVMVNRVIGNGVSFSLLSWCLVFRFYPQLVYFCNFC